MLSIPNIKKPGWSTLSTKNCSECKEPFMAKKHETLCCKCERERRRKTYKISTSYSSGWTPLQHDHSGGHKKINFTFSQD